MQTKDQKHAPQIDLTCNPPWFATVFLVKKLLCSAVGQRTDK